METKTRNYDPAEAKERAQERMQQALAHHYGHFYEAGVTRGLLGKPGR